MCGCVADVKYLITIEVYKCVHIDKTTCVHTVKWPCSQSFGCDTECYKAHVPGVHQSRTRLLGTRCVSMSGTLFDIGQPDTGPK